MRWDRTEDTQLGLNVDPSGWDSSVVWWESYVAVVLRRTWNLPQELRCELSQRFYTSETVDLAIRLPLISVTFTHIFTSVTFSRSIKELRTVLIVVGRTMLRNHSALLFRKGLARSSTLKLPQNTSNGALTQSDSHFIISPQFDQSKTTHFRLFWMKPMKDHASMYASETISLLVGVASDNFFSNSDLSM